MNPIPPAHDPRWAELFLNEANVKFEFLAANMVFTRLVIDARRDRSTTNLRRLVNEFREILAKNAHNPKVHQDIRKIFGSNI